jgi:tetrahydromethanopterin S-methyltransferase subunit H
MYLDSDLSNHTQMVQIFDSSVTALEKYVDYLGDNPNRPFNLQEILTIIQ